MKDDFFLAFLESIVWVNSGKQSQFCSLLASVAILLPLPEMQKLDIDCMMELSSRGFITIVSVLYVPKSLSCLNKNKDVVSCPLVLLVLGE